MNKSPTHRILVGNQRERTTLDRGFLSFIVLLGDNSVFVQMSSLSNDFSAYFFFFRCLIGNFLSFFCFFPPFDWNFFVFRGQGLTFSPWVKVYGKLGFRLKACRTAGHDIC